jgi:hypothetical protein
MEKRRRIYNYSPTNAQSFSYTVILRYEDLSAAPRKTSKTATRFDPFGIIRDQNT